MMVLLKLEDAVSGILYIYGLPLLTIGQNYFVHFYNNLTLAGTFAS